MCEPLSFVLFLDAYLIAFIGDGDGQPMHQINAVRRSTFVDGNRVTRLGALNHLGTFLRSRAQIYISKIWLL